MKYTFGYLLPPYLYTRVVRFLVRKHPSSLTHVDIYLNTPLHLAVQHERTEVASFLIHEGANVDAK